MGVLLYSVLIISSRMICYLGMKLQELHCDDPEDEYRKLASCRNDCGIPNRMCSCQSKCLIYNNCCEDFADVCPEEVKNTDRIKHLFGASISCHADGFFMVDACHSDRQMTTETSSRNLDNTTSHNFERMLSMRPVIDLFNGITYSSSSTFACYARNLSSPIVFNVYITLSSGVSFKNTQEFEKLVSVNRYVSYFPPFSLKQSMDDFCLEEAVTQCPEEVLQRDPHTYNKCRSFISYVTVMSNNHMSTKKETHYNNIYCKNCWEQPGTDVQFVTGVIRVNRTRTSMFSALMTTSDKGLTFHYSHNSQVDATWDDIVCHVNRSFDSPQDNFQCRAFKCHPAANLMPDGMCKYKQQLRLAIGDNYLPLTHNEVDKLPSLFSCIFRHFDQETQILNESSEDVLRPPFKHYDQRLDMILYYFEINVFLNIRLLDKGLQGVIETAVQSYHKFRERNRAAGEMIRDFSEIDTDESQEELQELASTRLTETVDINDIDSNINAPKQTMACACLQQIRSEICVVGCWRSILHQNDSKTTNYNLVSSCYNALTQKSTTLTVDILWLSAPCLLAIVVSVM